MYRLSSTAIVINLLLLTPWQAFIKSHQTHVHYTHKNSNTNTQMEIQKREIEIHKYRYPSAVFWCWLPGRCLLTKSAKLPILLLISPCDLHRHHDKDFGNIMLTIVTLEGKIINMYSSENKLAKLWQMQPNWYPSSQQPIIYIFVFFVNIFNHSITYVDIIQFDETIV